MKRWIDTSVMVITVPGRENNDGTETPSVDFRCEVETLANGKKRIRQCETKKRSPK